MITEWITAVSVLLGAGFVFIAALGVIRLPDVLCRMHAATKAGAFGVGLLLFGLVMHAGDGETAVKSILVVVAFYLTAPIAGHLLGRFAYDREKESLRLESDEWDEDEAG